ncbi:MAG TPA: SPOR domain-containing protein [Gemmatimonadaceae bacterium]
MRHHLALALLATALPAFPALARAQATTAVTAAANSTAATDSIFLRAQRLVAEGQGDSGRALVQAQLAAAAPGSPEYAEALYWRAVVAATAADAERDLRTLIIEYPLSTRAGDALMRLAQLEMTRGDDDQALTHLQRVVKEHPESPMRARAEFWMARVLFERNDAPGACARLADAARETPPSQVEMHNQIDYLSQRCVGVDTSAARAAAPAAAAPAPAPQHVTRERASAPPHTAAPAAPAAPAASTPAPAAAHTAAHAASSAPGYTVQVAAYSTRKYAEKLRATLAARGYDARVVDSGKIFRVRVGRYATRAEADAAAARMRASKMSVYVTEAEPR